ncbi:MAG: PAS domain S-box protein [Gemmatimonadales bacterium]
MNTRAVLPLLIKTLLLGVAYYATARLSLWLSFGQDSAPLAWLPSGLALGAMLQFGRWALPGIALGSLAAAVATGAPLGVALGLTAGSVLEPMAGTFLLRRAGFRPALDRLRDVLAFLGLAAVLATTVGATTGLVSTYLAGGLSTQRPPTTWALRWMAELVGVLLVAPPLLVWGQSWRPAWGSRRTGEAALLAASLAGVGALVFGPTASHPGPAYPFLVFPFVSWAAIRFGPRGVTLVALVLALLALGATAGEHGPFAQATMAENLASLDIFIIVMAGLGLVLAATVQELRRAVKGERFVNDAYRSLFEGSPFAMVVLDLDARVTGWNSASERLFGWRESEVLGRLLPTIPPGKREEFAMLRGVHARGETLIGFETQRQRRDGSLVDVSLSVSAIRNSEGRVLGAIGVLEDITETKRAAAEIDDRNRRIESIVTSALDAVISMNEVGQIVGWDGQAQAVFGWSREEVLGRYLADTIVPERYREDHLRGMARFRETGEGRILGRRLELAALHREGHEFPIELTVTSAKVTGAFVFNAFVRDISDSKRAERVQEAIYRISEAAQTAATLQALYAAIHKIVTELMPARNFYIALYDSPTGTLSFPYYVDEVDQPPPPRKLRRGLTEYVLRSGEPFLDRPGLYSALVERGEVESIGTPSVDWLGVPLKTPHGTIGVLVAQSYTEGVRYTEGDRDVLQFVSTQMAMAIEGKRAEEALRKSEERFRSLIENALDLIVVLGADCMVHYTSPSVERLLGYHPAELVGTSWSLLLHPDDAEPTLATATQALNDPGTLYSTEARLRHDDGTWRRFELVGKHLADFAGGPSVVFNAREVTERHRLEEELRQAKKMEAVGRLAGGVAHDFNNLLTSLLGHADLLLEELASDSGLRESVEEIRTAGQRAAALTRQLLAFSRKQVLEPRVLDLNAVASGVRNMLGRLIGEDIELLARLDPELGRVRADPGQLEQVILNLAVNARDAMPEGGKLVIETGNVDLSVSPSERFGIPPGRYATLTVRDTGLGMDAETLEHVFEPFFTTKQVGKGTGLGLATVYGIVKQSGGYIDVKSDLGRGTTFVVYLPEVEDAPRADERAVEAPIVSGTETVLLVEDDLAVRTLTRRVLERQGYRLLVAPNAEEALRVADAETGAIDLLLTDVVMPGLSGPRLAERLLPLRPGLHVLYMSGYTAAETIPRGAPGSGPSFLQKPFAPQTLLQRVREVLESKE